MVAHVSTIALHGIQATTVDVQVQIASGLSSFQIVGLPDNAVKESRERIRSAFQALGISLPAKRITVNLAPADLAKEGSHFDLPIAIGLLIEMGVLPKDAADDAIFMGELGLDASLSKVTGCLPAAIHASAEGKSHLFVPAINGNEAAWADNLNIFGATCLPDILQHIKGEVVLATVTPPDLEASPVFQLDFADVKGQETVKRVAEIAAAGGHNLLMLGTPGAGKSMIAQRLQSILPPLSPKEALEVSMIHSITGLLGETGLLRQRPFRAPHHSSSAVALCGGGLKAKPGEMSLAHRGLLFLDELPEFPRNVLETLRQPLESGNITVSRANHHVTYPARFQLIAAMNPCPCGYLGHPVTACSDSPRQIQSYRSRISGPLMDRIDLHVDVPVVSAKELTLPPARETSADIAKRVYAARTLQEKRYADISAHTNAEVDGKALEAAVQPDNEGRQLLSQAIEKFALSARGYHRILRVARTIADLAEEKDVRRPHIAEALAYRHLPFQQVTAKAS